MDIQNKCEDVDKQKKWQNTVDDLWNTLIGLEEEYCRTNNLETKYKMMQTAKEINRLVNKK